MNSNLLELNVAIISNETKILASQICLPITPSGHPYQITGNGIYVIAGPVPNPVAGILNPRFLRQTDVELNIQQAYSKINSTFKKKSKSNKSTLGDGISNKSGSISSVISKIKRLKKNSPNSADLRKLYIDEVIKATVKDILRQKLITPLRLPPSTLSIYAKQVVNKTIISDTDYGLYDLNIIIVETILKTINF